jgi:hypothetical protein
MLNDRFAPAATSLTSVSLRPRLVDTRALAAIVGRPAPAVLRSGGAV